VNDAKTPQKDTHSGFTKEERDAMKERARELKASATREEAEKEVLAKIASMTDADRSIAERIHAIASAVPGLSARLWYGSPAYAKDGKVVVFFQESTKFKVRYGTLGFSDEAKLDDGSVWPTSYAIEKLTAGDEAKIAALIAKAAG